MKYRTLGNTGFNVSAVSYGGIVSMEDGQEASNRYVSWAIDQGINYFDVAPTYGDAQEKLGASLKPYRKDVYLACKTAQRLHKDAKIELELIHNGVKPERIASAKNMLNTKFLVLVNLAKSKVF